MSLSLRALAIAAVLALAGIAAQWIAAPEISLVWRLGAAALIAALIYEAWKVRGMNLDVTARIRPTVFLSVPEPFELVFRKSVRAPVTLRFRFSPQDTLLLRDVVHEITLGSELERAWSLALTPQALGEHDLPYVNARILGPLGLAWWHAGQDPDARLRVAPAFLARGTDFAGSSRIGDAADKPIGSGLELHSLRDYRPGDPRRSIDWKASARARRLITREWTEDQHLEIMIALDASRTSRVLVDGLSRLGHFANVAARLSELAIRNDDKVGLLVFASEPLSMALPGRGMASVTRIRNMLTDAETQRTEASPISAMLLLRQRLAHRCLVIVMSDLDEQGSTGQLSQSIRLLLPKHSALVVGMDNTTVSNLGAAPADTWLDPYVGLAATEYLANRRANIRQLRRRGCQVVTAPPERLTRETLASYQALRQRHRI